MITILESQLKKEKIFHAYLLLSNSGHAQLVDELISLFDIGATDRYILKTEETLKISAIREIQQFVKFAPLQSKYKLVVIPEAHNLTIEAQNALLKTLEEPPGHSILFLIAENKNQLLDTILSRCQEIRLHDREEEIETISLETLKGWDLLKRSQWVEEKIKESSKGEILKLVDSWLGELSEKLKAGESEASELISWTMECRKLIKTNTNIRLLLENIIFNL